MRVVVGGRARGRRQAGIESNGIFQRRLPTSVARAFVSLVLLLLAGAGLTGSNANAATLSPATFNLADYKGKVVYLDFWASWCGPCRYSFPYMKNLEKIYGGGGDLVVIADNLDASRSSADSFLKGAKPSFPVMYDPKGVLANRFNVSAMPTSVLIDRHGKVRYIHKGFYKSRETDYTSHVDELINEKK